MNTWNTYFVYSKPHSYRYWGGYHSASSGQCDCNEDPTKGISQSFHGNYAK